MAEEMITCDRCGAVYKKSMRYCMKCGKLNYSHPDNASMLKYEPKEEFIDADFTPVDEDKFADIDGQVTLEV